jgi:Tol biopolymer transport system component
LIAAAAAAFVIALVVTSLLVWNSKRGAGGTLRVVPATSYPGRETGPSFSPDGSQIAFAWDGEKGNNFDVYVNLIGENRALRLTSDPRPEFSPAWSPDGRRIAFCRVGKDANEIVLIPALGGRERVVAKLPKHSQSGNPGPPFTWFPGNENASEQLLAWLPDSEFLAIVGRKVQGGPNIIFLLSVTTGEMQQLTFPSDRSWGDGSPSISPDGHRLAFTRSPKQYPIPAHLYVAPLTDGKSPAGEPERLTTSESDIDAGLAWAPDARRVAFPSGRGLWVVALNHRVPEALVLPGYNPTYPAISAKGDRLAFVQSSVDFDIWRVGGPAFTPDSSAEALSPPAKLISSTQIDSNPQYSPDGRLLRSLLHGPACCRFGFAIATAQVRFS